MGARISPTDVYYNQKSFWNQWSRSLMVIEQDLHFHVSFVFATQKCCSSFKLSRISLPVLVFNAILFSCEIFLAPHRFLALKPMHSPVCILPTTNTSAVYL